MAKMTFKLPEETIRKMEALGSHYDAVTRCNRRLREEP